MYVHSAPGFQLDRTTTGSPYFYGRQLARSVKVRTICIFLLYLSCDVGPLSTILTWGNMVASCDLQVVWGEATMVEAERMLFAAALQDPANQRFVLLSDR